MESNTIIGAVVTRSGLDFRKYELTITSHKVNELTWDVKDFDE